MKIKRVTTDAQCGEIAQLAKEIIPEYYGRFLPLKQISFFIETYQATEAIREQLKNGFEYYLVNEAGKNSGYLGINIKEDVLLLSKLYIRKPYRGKGIGNKLMEIVYQRALALHLSKIELYVVRENEKAIAFYLKNGFEIAVTISNPYDSGYTVEEYKMSKLLANR